MNQLINDICINSKYNGVVLISKDNKIIFDKGYGYANFEHNIPNTTSMIYPIASISKQFTAVAVLHLCDQGLINVSDPLSQFIPDYPNGDSITVHHILSNSSGIPNFNINMDFYDVFQKKNVLNSLIELFKHKPLNFTPGSSFEYSNSGYLLLQYIIELISKQSYIEYLNKAILNPIGIYDAYFNHYQTIIPNRVNEYQRQGDTLVNAEFVDLRIAGGGGALALSVKSLHLWNKAINQNKILTKESMLLFQTPHIFINETHHYSYGRFIAVGEIGGSIRHKIYHTGGGKGLRAMNALYPDDGYELIMISNIGDKDQFHDVYQSIQEIILKENI